MAKRNGKPLDPSARERVIGQMKMLAAAGEFDSYPRFKDLCTAGYDPQLALNVLALYSHDDRRAMELMDAARSQIDLWHSKLKAVEGTPAAGEDKGFKVVLAGYAAGDGVVDEVGEERARWERRLLAEGWRPPPAARARVGGNESHKTDHTDPGRNNDVITWGDPEDESA
ncbi:MAG: hypothetical protein ACLQU2_01245 [Candidatus Binataceae bacterium]